MLAIARSLRACACNFRQRRLRSACFSLSLETCPFEASMESFIPSLSFPRWCPNKKTAFMLMYSAKTSPVAAGEGTVGVLLDSCCSNVPRACTCLTRLCSSFVVLYKARHHARRTDLSTENETAACITPAGGRWQWYTLTSHESCEYRPAQNSVHSVQYYGAVQSEGSAQVRRTFGRRGSSQTAAKGSQL
jgi:hypothetical protein